MYLWIKHHLGHLYGLAVLGVADLWWIGWAVPALFNGDTISMGLALLGSFVVASLTFIAVVAWVNSLVEELKL